MNCKKTQEFILTDYIDGRMGNQQKNLIDQHLGDCHDCQHFLVNLKNEVIVPLNNIQEVFPDRFLWARIKEAIDEEQQQQLEKNLIPGFWEKLRHAVHVPRPAFALATFVTMIFMIGTTSQLFFNNQFVKINNQDQMEYLSLLMDEPADLAGNNGKDLQTPIEKYFL